MSVSNPNKTSRRLSRQSLNGPVFYTSSITIFLILLFAVIAPDFAKNSFSYLQSIIVENAGWYYVLTVGVILLCCFYLGFSSYGRIRLGPDHSKPEYSNISWFAMLFSAGMGIGLMFFGVAEPVMHFLSPPIGEGSTALAAREAMKITFFHWGLHAWAIYGIVALILAFFSYRHHLPLTLRSALYPLIGEKIYGPIGHVVDIFAVVGTLFGVATSLGYGVLQVNSGLHHIFSTIPVNITTQIILIIIVTGLATLSVTSGLDKGVKFLSELNLGLAVVLMLFILIAGPTVFLLQAIVQNLGQYTSNIVQMTFNLFAYRGRSEWLGGWTILYWGWWLSWAPFVGLFIAKISRGRTIRQFIVGVLLVPTGFTFIWMTVFGNSAISMILSGLHPELSTIISQDVTIALFAFLEKFPLSQIIVYVGISMVVVFFVTSADSGALVMDLLCSHGRGSKGIRYRIYWGVMAGTVAVILLLTGGLKALQTLTIASALPFVTVLMIAIFGLFKALKIDSNKQMLRRINNREVAMNKASYHWKTRLHSLMEFPDKKHVLQFINTTVLEAFKEVCSSFEELEMATKISQPKPGQIRLTVPHGDEIDFVYEVIIRSELQPGFLNDESLEDGEEEDNEQIYYRAEVHLLEGGQGYDVMDWTKEGIQNDIIDQYQKHLHFLHQIR